MRTIGPYSVLEELGRGGQGVVYLAEDTRLNRKVALKVIETVGQDMRTERLERFRREAEAASSLDHPNICGIYETGEAEGAHYISMRYIQGETLAEQIEAARDKAGSGTDSTPSTREQIHSAVHRVEKVARALHVAHEQGLIHRDIKPGNIMLKGEDPVILDFGLARDEIGDGMSLTHSGDLIGTPAYMSPEQLMAQRIPLDRRTDIYSLGATLYECLTLRRPFEALTRAELYQRIMTQEPSSATSINRAIPRDLRVVLETALEKDRDRRYQSALDFAEDLRRVRNFEPIRAKPIGRLLRLKRWTQRHPAMAVFVSAVLAGLVLALYFVFTQAQSLRITRAMALAKEASEAGEADQQLALLLALEATRIQRLPETLSEVHRALATSHEEYVLPVEGACRSVTISPDGNYLAAGVGTAVAVWRIGDLVARWDQFDSTGPRRLPERLKDIAHDESVVESVAFSPVDSTQLLSMTRNGTVRIWRLGSTSSNEVKSNQRSTWVWEHKECAAWSPEGDRFAMTAGPQIQIRNLAGEVLAASKPIVDEPDRFHHLAWAQDGARVFAAGANAVWTWDLGAGAPTQLCDEVAYSVATDRSGALVLLSGLEEGLRCVRANGEGVFVLKNLPGLVPDATFSKDGSRILAACSSGEVRVYDRDGNLRTRLLGHKNVAISSCFHPHVEGLVVTASLGRSVRIWRCLIPDAVTIHTRGRIVRSAVFSPAPGGGILTANQTGFLQEWSTRGHPKSTVPVGGRPFYADYSPDGQEWIVAYSQPPVVRVFAAGKPAGEIELHNVVHCAKMLPNGSEILACSPGREGMVHMLSRGSGAARWNRNSSGGFVDCSADGERVLVSGGRRALVYDRDGGLLCEIAPRDSAALTIGRLSRDGQRVLVGLQDGSARLYALEREPRLVRTLRGHQSMVISCAISPDGKTLLSCSRDNTARLWRDTGEQIAILKGHSAQVWRCEFSPDGALCVTAGYDGTARVWTVDPDTLIGKAEQRLTRSFSLEELERYRPLLGDRIDELATARGSSAQRGSPRTQQVK